MEHKKNSWKSWIAVGVFIAAGLIGYGKLSGRVDTNHEWINDNKALPADMCVIKDWLGENREQIREIPGIKKDLEYIIKILDKMERRANSRRRLGGQPIP